MNGLEGQKPVVLRGPEIVCWPKTRDDAQLLRFLIIFDERRTVLCGMGSSFHRDVYCSNQKRGTNFILEILNADRPKNEKNRLYAELN